MFSRPNRKPALYFAFITLGIVVGVVVLFSQLEPSDAEIQRRVSDEVIKEGEALAGFSRLIARGVVPEGPPLKSIAEFTTSSTTVDDATLSILNRFKTLSIARWAITVHKDNANHVFYVIESTAWQDWGIVYDSGAPLQKDFNDGPFHRSQRITGEWSMYWKS